MKTLHLSNGSCTVETFSNLFGEEGYILVCRIGTLDVLYPRLVNDRRSVSEGFQGPRNCRHNGPIAC